MLYKNPSWFSFQIDKNIAYFTKSNEPVLYLGKQIMENSIWIKHRFITKLGQIIYFFWYGEEIHSHGIEYWGFEKI